MHAPQAPRAIRHGLVFRLAASDSFRLREGSEMPRAYVCGTFDTKGPELDFIAERLRDAGVATCTVDVSTRQHADAVRRNRGRGRAPPSAGQVGCAGAG